jgi:hypothetical protein
MNFSMTSNCAKAPILKHIRETRAIYIAYKQRNLKDLRLKKGREYRIILHPGTRPVRFPDLTFYNW